MANQELRGHSSEIIANLKKRLPKAWKQVDWVFSSHCDDNDMKIDVAKFLLNKAIPTKLEGEGFGDTTNIYYFAQMAQRAGILQGDEFNQRAETTTVCRN